MYLSFHVSVKKLPGGARYAYNASSVMAGIIVECLDMPDSVYNIHEANTSLTWICSEGCVMTQFWNLSSSLFSSCSNSPSFPHSPDSLDHSPNGSSPPPRSAPTATTTPIRDYSCPVPQAGSSANNRGKSSVNRRKDEISVVVVNCDSVIVKKSSIEMLLSLDPDILLAVQTKLDASGQSTEFLPPHFTPSRNNRNRGGGGVLIATRENIIAEPLLEFDTDCVVYDELKFTWTQPRQS